MLNCAQFKLINTVSSAHKLAFQAYVEHNDYIQDEWAGNDYIAAPSQEQYSQEEWSHWWNNELSTTVIYYSSIFLMLLVVHICAALPLSVLSLTLLLAYTVSIKVMFY